MGLKKNNKELYRAICKDYDIPLHMSAEWMDAVCIKGDWDVVIAMNESSEPEGVLVYHYRKLLGFNFILMPPMCFYNGIHLFYKEDLNNYKRSSFQNKISSKLIEALPDFAFFYQQFHPGFDNWIPLYWKGFHQSTRYSYRLDTNKDKEEIWSGLKANLRRNISKAEKLCIIKECGFEEFWSALTASYYDRPNPFNKTLLNNVYSALANKGSCKLKLCLEKETKNVLAGSFIVNDSSCSYYLCGFYNPNGKEKAGLSYLLWYSIINNPQNTFDFEGSMIQEIEYFFRAFGATWTPHYRIWKIDSILSPLINWKYKNILNG